MPTENDDPECIVTSDEASALQKKYDLRAVVIIAVRKDGIVDTATDGEDRWHKDVIANYAHGLLTNSYAVVPFRTAFGVSTGGVPWRCSEEELAGLSMELRAWIAANTHPKAKP